MKTLTSFILIALVGFGVWYFLKNDINTEVTQNQDVKTYATSTYGISFEYPKNYLITEREVGGAQRGHYSIVLISEEDSAPRENSEGPTSINIDIFQNNLDKQTALGWITGSSNSNYKLGDGVLASTTVDGKEALSYNWSGLYEGRTVTYANEDFVYAFSVTRITPEDQIIKDFDQLLKTVKITK
jgi:hypothetical protein